MGQTALHPPDGQEEERRRRRRGGEEERRRGRGGEGERCRRRGGRGVGGEGEIEVLCSWSRFYLINLGTCKANMMQGLGKMEISRSKYRIT